MTGPSAFRAVMGPAYDQLHPQVRAFHDLAGPQELRGEVETQAAPSGLARLLARWLGTPVAASRGPLRFELDGGGDAQAQAWTRHFPGRSMRSQLRPVGGALVESLGPARLVFELREEQGELVMLLRSMRFCGLPCPGWLLPRVHARERGAEGRLHFDVQAAVPGLGRVVAYRGWLQLPEAAP